MFDGMAEDGSRREEARAEGSLRQQVAACGRRGVPAHPSDYEISCLVPENLVCPVSHQIPSNPGLSRSIPVAMWIPAAWEIV